MHESNCPWHEETTYLAARNGHLNCLQYAHESNCPWDSRTTWGAARYGHLECLTYIYEFCGEEVSWVQSNLEKALEKHWITNEACKAFLEHVQEDWKSGLNCVGATLKPAKKFQK